MLKDKPVVLFNRNADSGTREVFQELVLGKETKFSDKAAIKHDGNILSSVAKIPSALAYTSLGEVDETISVLAINGVKPSADTVRTKSYPLTRTPTLATKGAATGEVKAFIDFVTGPKGQAIVEAQKLTRIK
jgi:phosphate transport system substrate-binding protein